MKALDILCFLGDFGARYTLTRAWLVERYFAHMIADGRVLLLYKEGRLDGLLAFSIGNDYRPFWKKDTWKYVPHHPEDSSVYIELMACRKWSLEIRKKFQEKLLQKYPHIEWAVWHRETAGPDRAVIWRKRCHV